MEDNIAIKKNHNFHNIKYNIQSMRKRYFNFE